VDYRTPVIPIFTVNDDDDDDDNDNDDDVSIWALGPKVQRESPFNCALELLLFTYLPNSLFLFTVALLS